MTLRKACAAAGPELGHRPVCPHAIHPVCVCVDAGARQALYLVRVVERHDAQWPEAAEHGEDSQTQVVPGGLH